TCFRQSQPHCLRLSWSKSQHMVRGSFRADLFPIDGVLVSIHHVGMEGILNVRSIVWASEDSLIVGAVLGEQQLGIAFGVKQEFAQRGFRGGYGRNPGANMDSFELGAYGTLLA